MWIAPFWVLFSPRDSQTFMARNENYWRNFKKNYRCWEPIPDLLSESCWPGQTEMGRGRLGNCMFQRHVPSDSNDEPGIEHIEPINFLMLDYFKP